MQHGFEIAKEGEIAELGSTARLYRHIKTGAELLSVENNDSNKVFGISFKTPVEDSTGIAHILEHSVLCGSRKYPVKDPFVQLLKGSLQTFLNAMTYPDKTVYPVASQNLSDFYNLVDVYLDAVFHPRLTAEVFQQEGWHYEVDEQTGKLSYKGVVYNEMKGNYSSPDSLTYEYSQNAVFPDNAYGLDSGGDPKAIPHLTCADLRNFQATRYHPSNARLFFWGDDDPAERLRKSAEYLDDYERQDADFDVRLQPNLGQPVRVEKEYAAGAGGADDNRVTLSWLLPEETQLGDMMELDILAHLLVGTPAAPLRKALIDSGLGDDVTGPGLETDTRQMFFSTGLKGVEKQNIEKVEPLILKTIEEIVAEGFNSELIEASLNTLEFHLRENNTGRTPRGLVVMLRTMKLWMHGHDPLAAMRYEPVLEDLKSRIAGEKRYFEKILDEHFLRNLHRATLVLRPNPELGRLIQQQEDAHLDQIGTQLDPRELAEIKRAQKCLQDMQQAPDKPEDLTKIPLLSVADMEKMNAPIPIRVDTRPEQELIYHDLFTNQILYLDVGFKLDAVSRDELPYVGLLCNALIDIGTTDEDYPALIRRIGRKTGGIHPTLFISNSRQPNQPAAFLHLRGKSMVDQAPAMLKIFRDILLKTNLDDRERMLQIALEAKADSEAALLPAGHMVVSERLQSNFSIAGLAKELSDGTEFLFGLRRLISEIETDWEGVRDRLKTVLAKVVNRRGMHCNATLDGDNWQQVKPCVEEFVGSIPASTYEPQPWPAQSAGGHEALTAPSQVQYVGQAVQFREPGIPASGKEMVVSRYLKTAWLWEKIRVQGGAYGAISTLGFFSGVFAMVSYRDPQIDHTLEVYKQTADYLQKIEIDKDDLERAIVGAIGDLDSYKLPDAKGYTALTRHLTGRSAAMLQRMRDEVLATRPADFKAFGEKLEAQRNTGMVTILGDRQTIAASDFAKRHPDLRYTEVL